MRYCSIRSVALASLGVFLVGCCSTKGGSKPAPAQPAVAAAQSTATVAPVQPAPAEPPKTKEACGACKGVWAIHGLAETESCNCRTKDAGKPCRDGAECEGSCLADENRFEVAQPGPPAKGFYAGSCSEFVTAFGCFKFIPTGIRGRGPQVKDDAAEAMCVD